MAIKVGDLDFNVKLHTDPADTKKVAQDFQNALSKELERHSGSKDKSMMALNNAAKNTLLTYEKLGQKMEALQSAKYEPKFASKIQAEVSKMKVAMTQIEGYTELVEELASNPIDFASQEAEEVWEEIQAYQELQQVLSEVTEQITEMYDSENFDAEAFQELTQQATDISQVMGDLEQHITEFTEQQPEDFEFFGPETAQRIQEICDNLDNAVAARDAASQAIDSYQQQETAAQQAWEQANAQAQQSVQQQMDATTARARAQVLQYNELSGAAKAFGNVIVPVVGSIGQGLQGAFTQLPKTIRGIISGVGRLSKMFRPNLSDGIKAVTSQLKRCTGILIGFILGARGLQSIISKLRNWLLTGFKDIYNQDEKFKTQIDTIKQKVMDIQVALAKAFMPVIQMVLPYIKQLLDWILSLFGAISRFISTVTGIKAYTKAIKGLGGAAQNANKQLSKFDELNNLSDGGGNGLTPNDSSIGDPKKIENWFEFVRNIVDEVEKLLRSIPWEEVYKKARQFGLIVGQVINAIAKPSLWNAIGETIGGVITTLINFFNTLGNTIRFEDIGKSIVEAIRGLLDMIDFKMLMDTLVTWADGFWTIIKTVLTDRDKNGQTLAERIVDMITNSLSQIDWPKVYAKVTEIGQTLAQSLNQLINPDMAKEIGKTIGGLLMGAIDFAIAFFGKGGLDWENLGDTIASAIDGFFEQFDGQKFASAINNIVNGLITALKQILNEVDWDSVWEDIQGFLEEIDWKVILAVLVPSIVQAIRPVFRTIWLLVKKPLLAFISKTVMPEIQAFFQTIFANPAGLLSTVGQAIGTFVTSLFEILIAALGGYQIGNGIGEIFSLLTGDLESAEMYESSSIPALIIKMLGLDWDSSRWDEVWSDTFDAIGLDKLILWIEDIPTHLAEAWEDLKSIGQYIIDGIKEGIVNSFNPNDDIFDNIFGWIFDGICTIFGIASPAKETMSIGENIILGIIDGFNLVDFAQKMTEWWDTNVAPWFTLEKWSAIVDNIKLAIQNTWKNTKQWWKENIQFWWDENVAPWFTLDKWTTLLNPIKEAFSTVFQGAVRVAIDAVNRIIDAIEKFINEGFFSGINDLISKTNNLLPPDKQIGTISGNVHLDRVSIPGFAQGTVIPPSMSEFIARLGDNNTETEVVSPLSTIKEALLEALQESGGLGGGDINITLEVDGRELAKTMVRQNEIYRKSTGRPLLA